MTATGPAHVCRSFPLTHMTDEMLAAIRRQKGFEPMIDSRPPLPSHPQRKEVTT